MRSLCKRDINRIILFPLLLIIIVCTASVQGRGKDSKDLVENGGKGGKTQAMELRSGAKGRGSSTAEAPSRWRLCLPAWMSRRQQAEDKGICGDKGKGVAAQASAASAGGGGKDDDAKKGIPRPSVFVMLKDIMLGGAAKDRGFDLASWLSKGGHLDSASGPLLDTPLIVACHSGCIEAAEALIKHRADVGKTNSVGQTALHLCASCKATGKGVELAQLLLTHGARVDARDSAGNSTLCIAADAGDASLCEVLLSHGASLKGLQLQDLQGKHPDVKAAIDRHRGGLKTLRRVLRGGVNLLGGWKGLAKLIAVEAAGASALAGLAFWMRKARAAEK